MLRSLKAMLSLLPQRASLKLASKAAVLNHVVMLFLKRLPQGIVVGDHSSLRDERLIDHNSVRVCYQCLFVRHAVFVNVIKVLIEIISHLCCKLELCCWTRLI